MKTIGKNLAIVCAAFLLASCASQDEQSETSTQDVNQAVRDFIDLRELEELSALQSGANDGWRQINENFIIYSGRRDTYLIEFGQRCHELNDRTRITPDQRWDANTIRARFDTIRGCRIAKIYGLDEAEAAEIANIGEAPGSRN